MKKEVKEEEGKGKEEEASPESLPVANEEKAPEAEGQAEA